jgi:hypothetical protein
LGEQLADVGKDAGVGGGVTARRAADGRLVDGDDLVEVLEALDVVVLAGQVAGAVVDLRQLLGQDVVDEAGLAGAGDTGDRDEHAERDLDVDVLRLCSRAPMTLMDLRLPGGASWASMDGYAVEVLAGEASGRSGHLFGGTGGHDIAAVGAGAAGRCR